MTTTVECDCFRDGCEVCNPPVQRRDLFEGLRDKDGNVNIGSRVRMEFGGTVEAKTKLIEWLNARDGGGRMSIFYRTKMAEGLTWKIEIHINNHMRSYFADTEEELYQRAVDELTSEAGQILSLLK